MVFPCVVRLSNPSKELISDIAWLIIISLTVYPVVNLLWLGRLHVNFFW